jgi:hypothetical protein
LNGIIEYNNHGGFSGTGFVAPFWVEGDYLEYTIKNAVSGEQNIILRYSNGYPDDRTISLYVNGEKIRQVNLPNTIDWENWGDRVDKVTLNEGDNTIRYQVDNTDNGMFNIDYLLVTTSEVSAIGESPSENKISLYPNPNSSILTLTNIEPNALVKIISMEGKEILEKIADAEKMTFDVSNWKKGTYAVAIKMKGKMITRKVIIQ